MVVLRLRRFFLALKNTVPSGNSAFAELLKRNASELVWAVVLLRGFQALPRRSM